MTQPTERDAIDRIENSVERGVTAAEEIHRAISDVPFEALERLGVLEREQGEIKRIHDDTVSAIYDAVRVVSRKIARLTQDITRDLEDRPDAR